MRDAATRWVICYDIADDRRRLRLAQCLEEFGDRVQESVFEAILDARLFDIVKQRIAEIIVQDEDAVTCYAICAACDRRRIDLGLAAGAARVGSEIVFIV